MINKINNLLFLTNILILIYLIYNLYFSNTENFYQEESVPRQTEKPLENGQTNESKDKDFQSFCSYDESLEVEAVMFVIKNVLTAKIKIFFVMKKNAK